MLFWENQCSRIIIVFKVTIISTFDWPQSLSDSRSKAKPGSGSQSQDRQDYLKRFKSYEHPNSNITQILLHKVRISQISLTWLSLTFSRHIFGNVKLVGILPRPGLMREPTRISLIRHLTGPEIRDDIYDEDYVHFRLKLSYNYIGHKKLACLCSSANKQTNKQIDTASTSKWFQIQSLLLIWEDDLCQIQPLVISGRTAFHRDPAWG